MAACATTAFETLGVTHLSETTIADRRALQRQLGYWFADAQLLAQALTHRSAAAVNNERLEFLGDGILNFVIASALFERCPHASEGDLSRLRAVLVRGRTLAEIARELNLGALLILGPGEKRNGSSRRDSLLADVVEALLGAIYSEAGFDTAQYVILSLFEYRLNHLPRADETKDAKTRVQEWLQARGRSLPEYQLVERSGAQHDEHFVASCRLIDDDMSCTGEGTSRRKAEQDAARHILDRLIGAQS